MATNQLKISQKFDLDSFQGIDLAQGTSFTSKVRYFVVILTDCIQNRHLNLHMEAVGAPASYVSDYITSALLEFHTLVLEEDNSKRIFVLFVSTESM